MGKQSLQAGPHADRIDKVIPAVSPNRQDWVLHGAEQKHSRLRAFSSKGPILLVLEKAGRVSDMEQSAAEFFSTSPDLKSAEVSVGCPTLCRHRSEPFIF